MKKIDLTLKKIDILQCAVISAIIHAIMSLIMVIPLSLLFSAIARLVPYLPENNPFSLGYFTLFMPIIYGILGFILGIIFALDYNIALKITNGLNLTFETKNDISIVSETSDLN